MVDDRSMWDLEVRICMELPGTLQEKQHQILKSLHCDFLMGSLYLVWASCFRTRWMEFGSFISGADRWNQESEFWFFFHRYMWLLNNYLRCKSPQKQWLLTRVGGVCVWERETERERDRQRERERQRVSPSVVSNCWDPLVCSLPGSSIHGILQARILEWVGIPFSRGSSWPRDPTWITCIAGRFFTVWAPREAST